MDTLSFALGIASVVVIVISIVAVYAFVKVRELKKNLDDVTRDNIESYGNAMRYVDSTAKDIYSHIDSRLDKMQNKKQLLKD